MCLYDPGTLRQESIRGLSMQIRHINSRLLGSSNQTEIADCIINLDKLHELLRTLCHMK